MKFRKWKSLAAWLLAAFFCCMLPESTAAQSDPLCLSLQLHQLQIRQNEDALKVILSRGMRAVDAFQEYFREEERRVQLLFYLMSQQDRYFAFSVAFYSNRIAATAHEAHEYYQRKIFELQRVNSFVELFAKQQSELDKLKQRLLTPLQRTKLQETEVMLKSLRERLQPLAEKLNRTREDILQRLASIDAISEKAAGEQGKVISTVFFKNECTFLSVLPHFNAHLRFWLRRSIDAYSIGEKVSALLFRQYRVYLFSLALLCWLVLFLLWKLLTRGSVLRYFGGLAQKRKSLFWFSLPLAFGMGGYTAEFFTPGISVWMPGRISGAIAMVALFFIALTVRLENRHRKAVSELYGGAGLVYFGGILLNVLQIPYPPLVVLVTTLAFFAFLLTGFGMRNYALFTPADRIGGTVTLFYFAGATLLGYRGYAYPALTMMLAWFVILTLVQLVMAFRFAVWQFVSSRVKSPLLKELLAHLALPLIWIVLAVGLAIWLTEIYQINERLEQLSEYTLVNRSNLANITISDIVLVVTVGLSLYFLLLMLRLGIRSFFQGNSEFAMIHSFTILLNYLAWGLFLIFVLVVFDVQYSSILVVLGGMSMGVGFGFKEIVENFLGGIILLIGQHVRPGDIIEFDKVLGTVRSVHFRATEVETFDGAVIALPNTRVISKDVRNWTRHDKMMRKEVRIGVAYGSDIAVVRCALLTAAEKSGAVQKRPAPLVLLEECADNSLNFLILIWVPVIINVAAAAEYRERALAELSANHIVIPYPQLDIHFAEPEKAPQNPAISHE